MKRALLLAVILSGLAPAARAQLQYGVAASSVTAFVVTCATTSTPTTLWDRSTRDQNDSFLKYVVKMSTYIIDVGFDVAMSSAPSSATAPGVTPLVGDVGTVHAERAFPMKYGLPVYCRTRDAVAGSVSLTIYK